MNFCASGSQKKTHNQKGLKLRNVKSLNKPGKTNSFEYPNYVSISLDNLRGYCVSILHVSPTNVFLVMTYTAAATSLGISITIDN
jgi:hypothetical protein